MNTTILSKHDQNRSNGTQQTPQRENYVTPLANIVETADGYLLEAEMPGVRREGLDISVENGELVIHGKRAPVEVSGQQLYRESRGWDYRRVFEIDPSIDTSKINAKLEQGVLKLHLPKAESVKPRKIVITE
jgi:HSP20 family protein